MSGEALSVILAYICGAAMVGLIKVLFDLKSEVGNLRGELKEVKAFLDYVER